MEKLVDFKMNIFENHRILLVENTENYTFDETKSFVGRRKELKWIRIGFRKRRVCIVSGLGGVGKTLLACRFLQMYGNKFGQCGWLNAEGATSIELASALCLWQIDETKPTLLILDGAEGRMSLRAVLAVSLERKIHMYVLVTSQSVKWSRMPHVHLQALGIREATAVVTRAAGCDKQDAIRVARAMHNFPLALQQAAAYIREYHVNPAEYLCLLEQSVTVLEHRFVGGSLFPSGSEYVGYERSIALTVAHCVKQVQHPSKNYLAMRIMYTLAYLAPGPVHKRLLEPLVQGVHTESSARDRLDAALQVVAERSLVSIRNHTDVQMHALAALALRRQAQYYKQERSSILQALQLITEKTKDSMCWRPLLTQAHRKHLLLSFYRKKCKNRQALVFSMVRHGVWNAINDLLEDTHEDPKLFGADAMLAAVLSGDVRAPKKLVARGVPLQAPGCSPALLLASRYHKASMADELLKLGVPVDQRNDLGDTALLVAARAAALSVINVLLAAKADVNAVNKHGECALYEAVSRRDLATATLLIKFNAHVNTPNQPFDKQPLYWALITGNLQIARLFLNAGASVYWRGSAVTQDGTFFVDNRVKGYLSLVYTVKPLPFLERLVVPPKHQKALTDFLFTNAKHLE